MRMRKVLWIGTICLMLACVLCACDVQSLVGDLLTGQPEQESSAAPEEPDVSVLLSEIDAYDASAFVPTEQISQYVRITVRDYGEIVVRLYTKYAPRTVENFQGLVQQGFYDGLIFHRVILDFMIHGGGYDESGTLRNANTIPGEFASNGVPNQLPHQRGVISMARTNVPDSASSQFFICDATSAHLDGKYAAFGVVVAGMEVVDAIAAVQTNASDRPLTDVVIESAVFVEPTK